jgi:hypothetical protein
MTNKKKSPKGEVKNTQLENDDDNELLDINDPYLKTWTSIVNILKEIGVPKTERVRIIKPKNSRKVK